MFSKRVTLDMYIHKIMLSSQEVFYEKMQILYSLNVNFLMLPLPVETILCKNSPPPIK